jgi:FeS assembly protein IscX
MARKLRWTDVHDIAIELEERHPEADNVNLRFTDLHRWVMELPDFEDDAGRSNEKILEAIQAAWIEERR